MAYEIEKISILSLIFLFLFYIGAHTFFMIRTKKLELEIKEKPGNPENVSQYKLFEHLSKWFPVYYVIMLLIYFYVK